MLNHIAVSVESQYLQAQSQPSKNKYAFSYRISLHNQGHQAATLISRHWIITDGNGDKREVKGLGVVGEQPCIEPDQQYSYTSFSVLDSSVGTMEGSYQMRAHNGDLFDAAIEPFLLAVPGAVN